MSTTFKFPSCLLHLLATGLLLALSGIFAGCNSSPQAKEANYLRRGNALLQKKDYPRALLEFKNAMSAMPKDAEPYYRTAIAHLESGNFLNAVAALRKATELNPHHQKAQLKLAELMATSTQNDILLQAQRRLETVLSESPDNSEANDILALTEWKLGKTEDAITRLQATLRQFPARLQTSVQLARIKLNQKDLAGAETVLQTAVAHAPQSSPAELALGQLYMLEKDYTKAETELRKALQLDPKNGAALMGLAAIQVASQRLEEADRTYQLLSALGDAEFKPLHALFLYKSGKREAALAELEKLAKETPDDRRARSRLFAAYEAMGKTQAAQALVAAALKKNPKDTDALYQRAGLLMRAGKPQDAENDIKAVLRSKPDFAEAHMALAVIYKAENLQNSERQELNEALRIDPSLLRARLMLARSFTRNNQGKSALELLNGTPKDQQSLPPVIAERNWALLATGEVHQVRSIVAQLPSDSQFPEFVVQDAVVRMQSGDYDGARAAAERIISNNPSDLRGVRLMVDSYLAQKQPAKAEQQLKKLVAANPNSAPAATLLGQWYVNNKALPQARQAFGAALAADLNFESAILALAEMDYREHQLGAARERLLGLVARKPNDLPALLLLATLAGEMGDQDEAISRNRAALTVDPSNVTALNNLAYTLALAQPDEALKYAQQAAELAPENAAVQDTLGWVYYRKALYSMATTYLETAVKKEPTPRRQFHLAMSYLRSGNRDLGERTLQLALRQNPDLQRTEKGW